MHLLHHLVDSAARRYPERPALRHAASDLSYAALADTTGRVAGGLVKLGLARGERVAVYLPKQPEAVIACFATARAGGVFVPVNPQLKAAQVAHILDDSGAAVLVTSADRLRAIGPVTAGCRQLREIVVVDDEAEQVAGQAVTGWSTLAAAAATQRRQIDADLAALFYTSGSTGRPKGVMLTHRNLLAGAESVATYLGNRPEDRILAVLPLGFDYGFSQLTTAFYSGACVVLFDYLLPRDVIRAVEREHITGLAAVPPAWIPLARLEWPARVAAHLRYLTNSGGAMPRMTLDALRQKLPSTQVFLMYGLTEAFRSTYLDPAELDRRPDSMGKAIPNAEVLVLRPDGTPCAAGEAGELVHRGALVSQGYWRDAEKTAERFRPVPLRHEGTAKPEIAVWSGDTVRMDDEGFLYFVARNDAMIKTSGYRVSPTEVEEALYESGLVREAIAFGVPHAELGEAIVAVAVAAGDEDSDALMSSCRSQLANFMLPAHIAWRPALPRNANGKIDRNVLATEFAGQFVETRT